MENVRRELWIDLDGTLLGSHSLRLKRRFLKHSLFYLQSEFKLNILQALWLIHQIRKAIETPDSKSLNEERAALAVARSTGVPHAKALKYVREMSIYAFSNLQDCFFQMPGAQEFVRWAHAHFDLVLATNPVWPESVVKLRMSWSGIDTQNFLEITHAASMRACKPHVDYYQELALRRKPHGHAGQVLMIGDSLKKDRPVIALGIPFFWLRPSQELKQEDTLMWSGGFHALKLFLEKDLKNNE